MTKRMSRATSALLVPLLTLLLAACGQAGAVAPNASSADQPASNEGGEVTLTLGAYTTG